MITTFFVVATAVAQPLGKWEYDFSSRVQMRVMKEHFLFERCELDKCQPLSDKIVRVPKNKYKEVMSQVKSNPEHHFIADALMNYDAKPDRYDQVTYGISIGPEKFGVNCSHEVTGFIREREKNKAKDKKDYIFKYEGASNKYCRAGAPGESIRSIEQVEADVKELITLYNSASRKATDQ
jgi:hypothetical protein